MDGVFTRCPQSSFPSVSWRSLCLLGGHVLTVAGTLYRHLCSMLTRLFDWWVGAGTGVTRPATQQQLCRHCGCRWGREDIKKVRITRLRVHKEHAKREKEESRGAQKGLLRLPKSRVEAATLCKSCQRSEQTSITRLPRLVLRSPGLLHARHMLCPCPSFKQIKQGR